MEDDGYPVSSTEGWFERPVCPYCAGDARVCGGFGRCTEASGVGNGPSDGPECRYVPAADLSIPELGTERSERE